MKMDSFRVLLVDDEEEFLATVIKRLRKRDVNAIGAGSGAEALQMLEKDPLDVVVLDVKMPGMDGMQTLREIKNRFLFLRIESVEFFSKDLWSVNLYLNFG